ncbi:hypothetical protein TNCV_4273471 [Trichonephila clavipes]|nr:hypothetical protein TNCV_4273471 [Trichonephila clavipes]
MASVHWMFVEGLLLHASVTTSVFDRHPPFALYYTLGWGGLGGPYHLHGSSYAPVNNPVPGPSNCQPYSSLTGVVAWRQRSREHMEKE